MGLFDRIFGRRPHVGEASPFRGFTAYAPTFQTWNGQIYESELVRAAIDARSRHISKLKVEAIGTAKPKLRNRLKHGPNAWQTWSQFLYRLNTILDMQNTAFIVPVFDIYGEPSGVFPVLPSLCELIETADHNVYLRYQFQNGQRAAVEFNACGVLTKFQYKDDFFGESNGALVPTMELINIQNQGITEGIKSAATYRFVASLSNIIKPDDLKKERQNFNRENFSGDDGGGVLLFPSTYKDIKQVDSRPFVVDAEQTKIINEKVYNYFGISAKVLQNAASDDEMDAFFEGVVEPFAIQLSDVLTRMLFTADEFARGSRIICAANRLQYMSASHRVQMAKELGDRGAIMIDEIRELFNYAPLPDGAGQHAPIRGEYYMVDKTDEE